jgi:predicted RNA-binding Zn-ribbon protein involved in translation (DUF1610 family)
MTDHHGNATIPSDTKVFVCANCGALALSPHNICKVQGMISKADFCGSESLEMAGGCKNQVHNLRFKCKKCNRVAVNPEILCQPIKMEKK